MGYKHQEKEIIKVGYELFRKKGYHNLGINEILTVAKLPKGSFYNFFKSKEVFACRVIEWYGSNNQRWLNNYFKTPKGNSFQAIKDFYLLIFYYNEIDLYTSGCLLNLMSNEVGRSNDTIAAAIEVQFESWMTEIAQFIELGQARGEITKDFKAREIAEYLHMGLYGTYPRMKTNRSRRAMDLWLNINLRALIPHS